MHAALVLALLPALALPAVWAPTVFPQYEWCDVEVRGFAFSSPTTGLAVGSCMSVYRTLDGGSTWVRDGTTGDMGQVNDVAFGSPTFALAVGQNAIFQPTVLRSTDAGATFDWATFYLTHPAEEASAAGVMYEGQLTGVAIVSDSVAVASAAVWSGEGAIVRTTDGGVTWRSVLWNEFALHDVDLWGSTLVAVGAAGTLLVSDDAGVTWTQRSTGTAATLVGADDGYAVGHLGAGVRSTDGGATWIPMATGVAGDLRDVAVHGSTVHVAGMAGAIRASRDGGVTWTPEAALTSVDLNALAFPAPGVGFAGGLETILRQVQAL